jgi:DNA modification methylase
VNDVATRLDRIDWDFRGFVPSIRTSGVHALHWYPASFPPALACSMLDVIGTADAVFLDPFAGSGVSVVEAWLRGLNCHANDTNHMATNIIAAKIRLLRAVGVLNLQVEAEAIVSAMKSQLVELEGASSTALCSHFGLDPELERWFGRQTLAEITALLTAVRSFTSDTQPIYETIISSLLQSWSIFRNVHYTYIVDRTPPRHPPTNPIDVPGSFLQRVTLMHQAASLVLADLELSGRSLPDSDPTITNVSAEMIPAHVSGTVDVVLTSPPYLYMNDYVRSHYLSALILGSDYFDTDLTNEIGARRGRFSARHADHYLRVMDEWFKSMRPMLSGKGLLAVVIGESSSRRAQAAEPLRALMQSAEEASFRLVWSTQREVIFKKINNHKTAETIFVFESQ